MVMRRKKVKKILAVILSLAMLSISLGGCGSTAASTGDDIGASSLDNSSETDATGASPESTAMGRYVEAVIDLSDSLVYAGGLYKLGDGSLVIADPETDFLISTDNGVTWETDERSWRDAMMETYIMDLAVGADNSVGIIYNAGNNGISTEDGREGEEAEAYNPFDIYPELMIVKPDGTKITAKIPITEEDEYINRVWFSDSGKVLVSTYGPTIYEVKEDGSSEIFLTVEEAPTLIQFQDNLMIMDGYYYDGLLIYDMEKQEYIEDEVLHDFVEENYKNRSSNGGSFYDLYFFMGEENILYLAGKKGLHRHVIGGSAIEQVVDGSLSIFNNPANGLRGMVALDNSEFVALLNGQRVVRFTYNPDIPTVPNEKLKVYSLEDNSTVRQAITLYQTIHPEVFVEYEVGIVEGSAVTRDDALKNLNTKIMAGESPDVLILDNMPIDSYIEKGLLLDLSPILESLDGEDALFDNIVDAFRVGDGIYTIPCEIQLPVISGKKTYTARMDDLAGIADAIEDMRRDIPKKDLLGICSKKGIMRMFFMVSVPFWKTDTGEIDTETLADYFMQTKRIYDAQMEGLSEAEIEAYNSRNESYMEDYGLSWDDSDAVRTGTDYISYFLGDIQLACGTLAEAYDYAVFLSIQKLEGHEEDDIILMNQDIFYPRTLAGISAAAGNREHAQAFIRLLLGKENQSFLFRGFAVNKEAFNNIRKADIRPDGSYGSFGIVDEEENVSVLLVYWPDEEQIAQLEHWMETVSIPYIEDDLLEESVYEEGTAYLQGTQSLEDALRDIEKRVALYIAE